MPDVFVKPVAAAARIRTLLAGRLFGRYTASARTVHCWSNATRPSIHQRFFPQQQSTSSATFCIC